jgi:hypothetical protein
MQSVIRAPHGGSSSAAAAAFPDRPLLFQLQASRCVAANRRLGPGGDSRTAASAHRLFDHLVGNGEHPWRHFKAKRLGRLEVDEQVELGRLHDG